MPKKYVMENNAQGRSHVSYEQDITTLPEVAPKLFAMDLWVNKETPADLSGREDPTLGASFLHEPPDGGAIFRIVDYMPGQERTVEDAKRMHAAIGSVHVPSDGEFKELKHPSMHKTDTINYMTLAFGELWALCEERDVLLKPGDVLIQKGCMHGWRNTSDKPARLIAVLIDSKPA